MDTDYYTRYYAHQDEYQGLLVRSDHARLVQQAAATLPKRPVAFPIRGWMSTAPIAAGEWMQPKPASALIALDPTVSD